MSNICSNSFYAYSEDPNNLDTIEEFFKDWIDKDLMRDDSTIECYFDSKWTFPEEEMDKLYERIPNKEDIYMRCLSVEYGVLYHALWVCDSEGWEEV